MMEIFFILERLLNPEKKNVLNLAVRWVYMPKNRYAMNYAILS